MLTQRLDDIAAFTRRDASRLGDRRRRSWSLVLTAILGADFLPGSRSARRSATSPAPTSSRPRALEFVSEVLTDEARAGGRDAVEPQYDLHDETRDRDRRRAAPAFDDARRAGRHGVRAGDLTPEERRPLLETAVPDLSRRGHARRSSSLDAARWAAVRTEAARVLDATLRTELRDTEVAADARRSWPVRWPATSTTSERMLAAELIAPLRRPELLVQPGR